MISAGKNMGTVKKGSYIKDCLIWMRPDDDVDALFTVLSDSENMIVKLDKYAIIPREEYERLTSMSEKEGCEASCKSVLFSRDDKTWSRAS